jgi:hypothetical protein
VHEPPNDNLAASDTHPLRHPPPEQSEAADKAPTRPGSEDDSVTDDTQPPVVRVWPPRLTTDTWTKSDVDISLRDTVEETQPLRKRASAPRPAAPESSPVATEAPRCPRCQARLIDPNGFGLCPQCGYCRSLEEGEGAAWSGKRALPKALARRRHWLWILAAAILLAGALALALFWFLP